MVRASIPLLLALLLPGCMTPGVVPNEGLETASPSEAELLDVGIVVFDTGLDPDEPPPDRVSREIRGAEANYYSSLLRDTLDRSGQWGAVRVVPVASEGLELTVSGRILESNGEVLRLQIEASDATGAQWLSEKYATGFDELSYAAAEASKSDPAQQLLNRIANDLARARRELAATELARVRNVAEMRFAADLAPEAFGGYVEQDGDRYVLVRLPAYDDPAFQRVLQVRTRDAMFMETLNEHYASFYREMQRRGYDELRKSSLVEERAYREVKQEAWLRQAGGIALIVAGVAAAIAGDSQAMAVLGGVAATAGARVAISGFEMHGEAKIHREAIEELIVSFEADVAPVVVEMQTDTVRLTGTAAAQYEEWRKLLDALYRTETEIETEGAVYIEPEPESPDPVSESVDEPRAP
jgi:hypothetical protein